MCGTIDSERLKATARNLGFSACGLAKAAPVEEAEAEAYRRWIASGGHADMRYLEGNIDKRLDPTLLLPGAKTIVVVAMNYTPRQTMPDGEYQLAAYALGKDYHDVVKQRLRELLISESSDNSYKIAVDTVPILERYWAVQAGLGFIGRNHQLIIPGAGSMFFLGEIITTAEADHYDEPCQQNCGNCKRCVNACPTSALDADGSRTFSSSRCLSYQTIENRGPLSEEALKSIDNCIYGCDCCQQVCPWNRMARPSEIPELMPSEALMQMRRADWQQLSVEQYQRLFKGSAVKRAKYEGLMRNIRAAEEKNHNS